MAVISLSCDSFNLGSIKTVARTTELVTGELRTNRVPAEISETACWLFTFIANFIQSLRYGGIPSPINALSSIQLDQSYGAMIRTCSHETLVETVVLGILCSSSKY